MDQNDSRTTMNQGLYKANTIPLTACHRGAVRGIRVRVGDLVRSSACEALVCSVANGEQELARCGAVAAAFAQTGGVALQNIFSALGGVAEGKVHKAAGTGNIQCSAILFLGARDWNGDSSKQVQDVHSIV
jgi:hypothetical protein